MHGRRHVSRIAILVLASATAGCLLVAGVTLWLRPQWFDTHQEAIGYILTLHGITYQQVEVMHVWPDTLDRAHYAADVMVLRADTNQVAGRIECASGMTGCYLRIVSLGIIHEPVPDLAVPSPWRTWLKQNLARFARPS